MTDGGYVFAFLMCLAVLGVVLDFVNVGFIFKLKATDNQVYHFAHDIATSSIIVMRACATYWLTAHCAYGCD